MQGATVLEVIVSSIIFLVIFILSLETTVKITSREPLRGYEYLLAVDEVHKIRDRYIAEEYYPGEFMEEYDWGTVRITIGTYQPYPDIGRIDLELQVPNHTGTYSFTYLYEPGI